MSTLRFAPGRRPATARRLPAAAAALAALTGLAAAACTPSAPAPSSGAGWLDRLSADADATAYAAGAPARVTLVNGLDAPVYLPGCNAFTVEVEGPRGWEPMPGVVCVWEGVARRIGPGTATPFDIPAPAGPAVWRVRFDVATGCAEGQPLSQSGCAATGVVVTPDLAVR